MGRAPSLSEAATPTLPHSLPERSCLPPSPREATAAAPHSIPKGSGSGRAHYQGKRPRSVLSEAAAAALCPQAKRQWPRSLPKQSGSGEEEGK